MIKGLVVRTLILALMVLAVSAFVIDWNALIRPDGRRDTNDAVLQGNQTQLASRVAGDLVAVPVKDYSTVHAGDLLFQIDDEDYRARQAEAAAAVSAAAADIAETTADLALQSAQIAAANAGVKSAEADLDRAQLERRRQAEFADTESYSARNWENAAAGEARQAATVAGQKHALSAAETAVDVLKARLAAGRAALQNAEAMRKLADIELGYTRITAPYDGFVTARLARLGEYVAAGRALITLVPAKPIWAVANYREVELADMRPGQAADVTIDALPGMVLHGHVDSVEPQSQASGARLPPDRATGNFTKIVQRIPVKIALDPRDDLAGLLRPGLSVETYVYTRERRP